MGGLVGLRRSARDRVIDAGPGYRKQRLQLKKLVLGHRRGRWRVGLVCRLVGTLAPPGANLTIFARRESPIPAAITVQRNIVSRGLIERLEIAGKPTESSRGGALTQGVKATTFPVFWDPAPFLVQNVPSRPSNCQYASRIWPDLDGATHRCANYFHRAVVAPVLLSGPSWR